MKNIMSNIFRLSFTSICLVIFTLPAMAWDDVGHKITAYIAWQQMSPQARDAVIKILRKAPEDSDLAAFYLTSGAESESTSRREYFELVATWADIIRSRDFKTRFEKYHKGNWHYADTFWKQTNGKTEPVTGGEDSGEAVLRLAEFDKILRDPDVSDKEKAIATAWMMHLSGDIHQPLHTSARITETEPKGDRGGNLFLLSPQNEAQQKRPQNLHGFWDSIVVGSYRPNGQMCEREYIEAAAGKMMKRYPLGKVENRLALGDYDTWQRESFAFINTDVYSRDLKRFELPPARYRRNALRVAERELTLAGYRLGKTLDKVFGAPPAVSAP